MKFRKLKNEDGYFILTRRVFVNGKTKCGWITMEGSYFKIRRKLGLRHKLKRFYGDNTVQHKSRIRGYRGWLMDCDI